MSLGLLLALAAGPSSLDNRVDTYLATVPMTVRTAEEVNLRCETALDLAHAAKTQLEGRTGKATMRVDFAAFDTLSLILSDASNDMSGIAQSNPDASVRNAADTCAPKLASLISEVSLSRPIFDRLSAIPNKGLNNRSAYTLKRVLLSYHLAGIAT